MRAELNNSLPWYLYKTKIKYPEIQLSQATAVVFLIPEIHGCQLPWKEIISLRDFQKFYLIEIAINSITERIKKRKEKNHTHLQYIKYLANDWTVTYDWRIGWQDSCKTVLAFNHIVSSLFSKKSFFFFFFFFHRYSKSIFSIAST